MQCACPNNEVRAALCADAKGDASKLHAPTKDGKVKSFMDHEDSVYSESLTNVVHGGPHAAVVTPFDSAAL